MAKDMSDTVRDALTGALKQAVKSASDAGPAPKKRSSPFGGAKGIAAGAGLAAAAPLAKKGVDKIRSGAIPMSASGLVSKAGDSVGSKLKDTVSEKVDQAGGAGGIVKDAASGMLPGIGGGGDDDDKGGGSNGMPGVGKGRRMPIQQSVDVAVPLETAYNQFTQFEDWPNFMHRVTRVTQTDDCTISFATKIWGKTKEFESKITTQRPDERIKWAVASGITHSGVVTFHELAPRLTRVEVTLDVAPGSLLEKAARGMRHIKRAVRADLARFKAFIEMQENETGAWRGVIEDGELVEPHDDSYDDEREYSEIDDIYEEADVESSEDDDEDDEGDDEEEHASNGNGHKEKGADGIPMPPRSGGGRFARGSGGSGSSSGSGSGSGNGRSRTAATSSGTSSRSSGGTKSKPSSGGTKSKSSSGGTSSKSSSGGTRSKSSGGTSSKSSSGGTRSKSSSGGTRSKSSSGGTSSKSSSGGGTRSKASSGGGSKSTKASSSKGSSSRSSGTRSRGSSSSNGSGSSSRSRGGSSSSRRKTSSRS